jgi:hypothetical protein
MAAPRRANGRISRWHAIGNAQWWRGGSGGPRHRDRVPSTVQSVAVVVGRATGNEGRRGTFARARSRYPVESVVDGSSGCLRVGHMRLIQSCVAFSPSRDVAKNETQSYHTLTHRRRVSTRLSRDRTQTRSTTRMGTSNGPNTFLAGTAAGHGAPSGSLVSLAPARCSASPLASQTE